MAKGAKKKTAKKKRTTRRSTRSRGQSSDLPIVIYIHGIGDQPEAKELKQRWDLALFGRQMEERTRMAYWSDLLHAKTGKKKRAGTVEGRNDLEAATLLQEANIDPTDPKALRLAQALAETLAGSGIAEAPRKGMRSKILPLPGFLRRPVARRLLRWLVKDTAAYFFDPAMRRKIRQRLIEQLPTGGEPFVLVSHSQGTIVAFEVLSGSTRRADVELFVTMGSPLGIQEVQDGIKEGGFELRVPDRIRAWRNFADRLDPVAIDADLASDFEPRGTIHDRLVVNERTKSLLRFNPHSSFGYLANPAVRSVVHHAHGFDSAARFLVARDVAEDFVGEGVRRPVLIEALHPGYNALGEDRNTDTKTREGKQNERLPSLNELSGRIDHLAEQIRKSVSANSGVAAANEARVQTLRKYVAAHLTPEEVKWLALEHKEMNVYAIWRSSAKSKLLHRSHQPIKVDAARASYKAMGQGITWAVLDTGARHDHPHLKNSVIDVLDCTTAHRTPRRITNGKDADRDGHGTHVAGIIAGQGNNGKLGEIFGVAPQAKLIVYKVLDDEGFGEDAWIIKAIDDIYRRNDAGTGLRIHGVNLSLGGPFDATVYGCGYSPICKELRDLWRQGVLVCVAAGNEGRIRVLTDDGELDMNTQLSIGDPANLDDCIAVGSVNTDQPHLYGISYFSSRGPTADGRAKPDLVAPGERITSCNTDFKKSGTRFERLYRSDSGTSMACPHVSGMLAAFLSARREFRGRPDEVKRILLDNCNDLERDRYHQGAGMPNLMRMLLNT